ncbi:MAG TPA: tetratricopeptide repeat protein [Steroidobacteraceae bacterium]|jgi:protein O-GlcNAc transferase|nr:tetratricopeptide repeat protein [Steroidobacteraceae bacterium]
MSTSTVDQLLGTATERHRAGHLAEARRLYQEVLSAMPTHAVAAFRGGLVELQDGHPEAALVLIARAAALAPDEPRHHFGLGQTLQALHRHAEAAAAYRRALQADPSSADAHFALGVALQSQGDHTGAIVAYRSAVALQPDHVGAIGNLGIALQESAQIDEAVKLLRTAAQLRPATLSHALNLGIALCRQRNFAEAETVLRGAILLQPDSPEVLFNLGNALHGLGRLREAADQYGRALALRPRYPDALNNLGNIHKELGEFASAEAAYGAAIEARPDYVTAWNNLGCLLRTMGRTPEAELTLRRGLQVNPAHSALHDNLGSVLKDLGQLDEAIECFRKAVQLDPGNPATHGNLAYALCFQSLQADTVREECLRWNERFAAKFSAPSHSHSNDSSPARRLRIGYVSPDFRDHCQSLFTIPLLSRHDHAAFEIFCYSSVERPDDLTRRIQGLADHWREVRPLDDEALASVVRDDGIDILVDLTMHMAGGRPLLFARRPAPVQIAWLAYPGTTGMRAMDYRLTDARLDPPGFENHYSERSIRLPDSFWCYDPLTDQPQVNALPALERGYVTFGCLNNPCKLTDSTLQLWGAVMRAVPDSRLRLLAPEGPYRTRLLQRLAAQGIDAARVGFVPYRMRSEYLGSYHDIDIGLDTFPYNGHTTSLDSLWMGVPTVTRVGETCVGRGGLSQLFQLGLLELAAESDLKFVAAATALAGDLERLADLRAGLRSRLERSPLMDAARFARGIETVYRGLWKTYCQERYAAALT